MTLAAPCVTATSMWPYFPELLDVPVPRYTSFPTAAEFGDKVGAAEADAALRVLSGDVSLYVHIPYCAHLCQFAGFIKRKVDSRSQLAEYVECLVAEISLTAASIPPDLRKLTSLYFGGGTPSVLSIDDVRHILDQIRRSFDTTALVEASFEGEANSLRRPGYVESLGELGFNRLSFGVQTTHDGMRNILNLKPSMATLASVYSRSQEIFDETMIDFMFGWPGQTASLLEADLDRLFQEIQPDAVEAFLFEPLDASPAFLTALAACDTHVPKTAGAITLPPHVVITPPRK